MLPEWAVFHLKRSQQLTQVQEKDTDFRHLYPLGFICIEAEAYNVNFNLA